jgi:hypothetical protein
VFLIGQRKDEISKVLVEEIRHVYQEIRNFSKVYKNGGQGGIRTLGNITATHAFQACSFDHSDTCPFEGNKVVV